MADQLICDGCGAVMDRERHRLRLLVLLAGRGLFDSMPSHDFCNPGCLSTWAFQQETEIIQNMGDDA